MDKVGIYEINKAHLERCEVAAYNMPEGCASLIIADKPYFRIKGEFDFVWQEMQEYQKAVDVWAKAFKHLLAPNGTLLVYGHAKNIAYDQVVFDKYFKLENSLVWEKKECQTKRSSFEAARSFAPVTERILMYSNFNQSENDWSNNNASVYCESFDPIRLYLREGILMIGVKACADYCGVTDRAIGHYISKSQWLFPTKEKYEKMQELGILLRKYEALRKEYEALRKEYEALRKEYEALRRPFNNWRKLTDVLHYSQETHITKQYDHPTQKPPKLTTALIDTCTRKGDLVVVPFAGSGVECAVSLDLGRKFVGFDIEQKYVNMTNKRVQRIKQCPKLF